jgi:murein DD-endopeptidase MepM/ murein hydrolase activator NlpD
MGARARRFAPGLAVLTLCGAGGAFAIASMAPDAADLPLRNVLEAVQPLSPDGVTQTVEPNSAVPGQPLTLYRSDISRASDTADTLLARLGINDAAAAAFLRSDATARKSLWGRGGRSVTAEANGKNALLKLTARWVQQEDGNFTRLVVEATPSGFTSGLQTAALTTTTRLGSGSISSSLFAATDEARLPDSIATQVAEIFSGDIDFHRALRKGDRFSVTYESLEGDGEPMRAGRVLSAEFVNNGKTYQAMWFAAPTQGGGQSSRKGAYYTLDGKSLNRAFLASPLEFSRITSGFKMRLHPILQTWKQHLGVDYAAPTGTAVRSIGDGVVEFSGVQRGFGNVVIIDHGKANSTVYAHLSKINVQKGEKVTQSQNIGAVGTTGWSTGPHLHFEFRVNGQHQDPLTMAQKAETLPVAAEVKPLFDMTSAQARVALAAAGSVRQATAE